MMTGLRRALNAQSVALNELLIAASLETVAMTTVSQNENAICGFWYKLPGTGRVHDHFGSHSIQGDFFNFP
jgi:hypothetical protein